MPGRCPTCVIVFSKQNNKDVGVSPGALFFPCFYFDGVRGGHGCKADLVSQHFCLTLINASPPLALVYTCLFRHRLDKYLNRLLFYHRIHEPVPLLKYKPAFEGCVKGFVTFLLQPQSGSCPLIVLVLPHEGLVHRDQLPGYLPVIFIHGQPASTREIVPAGRVRTPPLSCLLQIKIQ